MKNKAFFFGNGGLRAARNARPASRVDQAAGRPFRARGRWSTRFLSDPEDAATATRSRAIRWMSSAERPTATSIFGAVDFNLSQGSPA